MIQGVIELRQFFKTNTTFNPMSIFCKKPCKSVCFLVCLLGRSVLDNKRNITIYYLIELWRLMDDADLRAVNLESRKLLREERKGFKSHNSLDLDLELDKNSLSFLSYPIFFKLNCSFNAHASSAAKFCVYLRALLLLIFRLIFRLCQWRPSRLILIVSQHSHTQTSLSQTR